MVSTIKKLFEVNFFLSNILIPLVALTLYCGSFAYLSSRFLLEGVNYYFTSRLVKYLLFVVLIVVLLFLAVLKTDKEKALTLRLPNTNLYPSVVFFLLLPLSPVVQYIVNNQKILSPTESLYVLILALLFSSLYVFVIPAIFRKVLSIQTLMILGLTFVFTIINMSLVSSYFAWFEHGSLKIQLILFVGVFLGVRLLYVYDVKILYILIVSNFLINSSVQLLSQKRNTNESVLASENKLLSIVEGRTHIVAPNIYLLIYDAYIPNETMLMYGIDNTLQEAFLEEHDFELYPHTYSIGSTSVNTMSRVLDASTEFFGDQKKAVSGDGIVQNALKGIGYETYGLFWSDFMFRGIGNSYDHAIPERTSPPYLLLVKAILVGEFRFNAENFGYGELARDRFVEAKQDIFNNVSGNQIFVYMHSDFPGHSQNSGTCRSNETELFEERVKHANIEMRQDVKIIVENDPGAIIIVAGDHGPYLTKNCFLLTTDIYDVSEISRLDIQDRHATFLAIRWPTDDFVEYDNITVLQDLFPAIFAYLYQDAAILEAKIEPVTVKPNFIGGTSIHDGIIIGGINDGEPLFLSDK